MSRPASKAFLKALERQRAAKRAVDSFGPADEPDESPTEHIQREAFHAGVLAGLNGKDKTAWIEWRDALRAAIGKRKAP